MATSVWLSSRVLSSVLPRVRGVLCSRLQSRAGLRHARDLRRIAGVNTGPAIPFACSAGAARASTLQEVKSDVRSSGIQRSSVQENAGPLQSLRAQPGASVPTFQEAVQLLQAYWGSVGCAVMPSSNTEVGAGTMNPATFLRVLGPEPWNVAYMEPSVRPDDSRYGDNPNRLQQHTQFQVILKPDPGNPQELFLGSLEALGIDVRAHDLRFVEDNWESPVLGAWGLGWEVWLDGLEITQFTYFQMAGSLPLKPVAVEITYGLERILMALQGVDHFKKIKYSQGITYGELLLENEKEMSEYNLDHADIARTMRRFELYDEEAQALLERGLAIPAYNHLLKASHVFNVLDARGAVGVTERARFFGRMRALARQCAQQWVATRERLEHPLGVVEDQPPPTSESVGTAAGSGAGPRTFVLEIGSEELPPQDVVSGLEQLETAIAALLKELRLTHTGVTVHGTPRRLAVIVEGLVGRQSDTENEVRGPPASKALDSEGKPTKAAQGFCKKAGVSVDDLFVKSDGKGTDYVFAVVRQEGRPTAQVLSEALPGLVSGLNFPKTMRWNSQFAYSRPMRWLLALHGEEVVPFTHATLASGRSSRVLRTAEEPDVQVSSAEAYVEAMAANKIDLCMKARADGIWATASELAAQKGGRIPEGEKTGGLLQEVANLVEAPRPIIGGFDPGFLALPREVLITVMKKHQRYFAVEDGASGQLLPLFVAVANGNVDEALVRTGNEAVLRARYEDATFFYKSDKSQPLASFSSKLSGITFQEKLGSMLEKSQRVEAMVGPLAAALGASTEAAAVAAAAAPLARADLGTSVVMEFTALAGVMGRHYCLLQGETQEVAEAVFESVLPRTAGDQLPRTEAGTILAVADRLDSLVGLYAVGCGPSASADPFGLRRSAYGLVQAVVENSRQLDLREAIAIAAKHQPVAVPESVCNEVLSFVVRRLEQLLIDGGGDVEVVRAVLAERGHLPTLATASIQQVEEVSKQDATLLGRIVAAYARPTRIIRGKDVDSSGQVDEALFEGDAERALWEACQQTAANIPPGVGVDAFLSASVGLIEPLEAFFSNVFVMAEDEAVRKNRLALLNRISSLPKGVIDLSLLPGF